MSLKTRFMLLILGTVLIPNVIIILIVGLSFGGIQNIRALHVQMSMYHTLNTMLQEPVDSEKLYSFLDALPREIDYYILDGNKQILKSSIGKDNLQAVITNDRKLQALVFSFKNRGNALLLIHLPVFEKYALLRNTPFQIIAPLLLLSVLTLLSLGVIRSINISLKRIEEATRKVAEGRYDIELPVKGNDSIASLSRSFNLMVHEVKEEYSRRSRFFMGVSHDLKTPLASISGYADAIIAGYAEDKDTLDKYAGIIKSKSSLLLDRIFHLIEFVKLETGDWKSSFRKVLLKNFLSELLDTASVDAELYKYTLEVTLKVPNDLSVLMDEELIRRVFDNIIHNAFRYAYKESTITVTAEVSGMCALLSITNSGKGIPKKDLNYIFEPSYRGSATRNEDGFGLGLATVASVIKSHGWKITVDSVPGKETSFKIIIPLD